MITEHEIRECAEANEVIDDVISAILTGFRATWNFGGELRKFSQYRLNSPDWGEDVMLRECMDALKVNMTHPDVATKYRRLQGVTDLDSIAWSDAIYIGAWLNELFCFG